MMEGIGQAGEEILFVGSKARDTRQCGKRSDICLAKLFIERRQAGPGGNLESGEGKYSSAGRDKSVADGSADVRREKASGLADFAEFSRAPFRDQPILLPKADRKFVG